MTTTNGDEKLAVGRVVAAVPVRSAGETVVVLSDYLEAVARRRNHPRSDDLGPLLGGLRSLLTEGIVRHELASEAIVLDMGDTLVTLSISYDPSQAEDLAPLPVDLLTAAAPEHMHITLAPQTDAPQRYTKAIDELRAPTGGITVSVLGAADDEDDRPPAARTDPPTEPIDQVEQPDPIDRPDEVDRADGPDYPDDPDGRKVTAEGDDAPTETADDISTRPDDDPAAKD